MLHYPVFGSNWIIIIRSLELITYVKMVKILPTLANVVQLLQLEKIIALFLHRLTQSHLAENFVGFSKDFKTLQFPTQESSRHHLTWSGLCVWTQSVSIRPVVGILSGL